MPFRPTLSQLRAYVAVASTRHFRDAAAEAGVSQSALSQALATLEAGLGTQLVERTTRRVLVTPEGERLLPAARAVLDAVELFREAAQQARPALTGRLRLGVIPTVAPYLLPAALQGLREGAPELQVEVREDQTERLLDALRRGRVDVAVLALPVELAGVAEIPLYDEDFLLVVPPGHADSGACDVAPEALRTTELLLLDEGHCLRDQALDLCRKSDALASVVADSRASSLSTVVQLVAGGLGSTLLPESALPVENRRGELGVARFVAPAPGRRIALVYRASSARSDEYRQLAALICDAGRDARLPVRFLTEPGGRDSSTGRRS